VAKPADRLQVVLVVGAAARLVDDVVDCVGSRDKVALQADLAQATVALHHAMPDTIPCRAIPTLVPAASCAIGEPTTDWMRIAP
jgi:hypothetical protein